MDEMCIMGLVSRALLATKTNATKSIYIRSSLEVFSDTDDIWNKRKDILIAPEGQLTFKCVSDRVYRCPKNSRKYWQG